MPVSMMDWLAQERDFERGPFSHGWVTVEDLQTYYPCSWLTRKRAERILGLLGFHSIGTRRLMLGSPGPNGKLWERKEVWALPGREEKEDYQHPDRGFSVAGRSFDDRLQHWSQEDIGDQELVELTEKECKKILHALLDHCRSARVWEESGEPEMLMRLIGLPSRYGERLRIGKSLESLQRECLRAGCRLWKEDGWLIQFSRS